MSDIISKKTRLVLIDCKMPEYSKRLLQDYGVTILETKPLLNVHDCTATHPDMQFVKIGERKALVASELKEYYKSALPDFDIVPVYGIHSPYPYDCKLNFTIMGDKCFITEEQLKTPNVSTDKFLIKIRQGYSRCNICILNENAVITSDAGIAKAAEIHGIRVYVLPDDEIYLEGYKNGFWGGCSGLIDNKTIFFNGNIEALSCCDRLIKILEHEKLNPLYSTAGRLTDNGSVISVF